mgnify:CR=1 FL=1
MPATQIYSVVNTIANNIGYSGSAVVDASSFAAFAANGITGNVEAVYNTLFDLIGRTVIAIDEAEDEGRGIVVDAFEYGSILQKLSFISQASQSNSDWDISNPENPYTVAAKGGVVQKFFEQTIPTYCWEDVAYDKQLREAFHSPERLAGFIEGLYTRMRNSYKISKLGLSDAAIGALVAYVVNDTTDMNAARRVRHILTEYNTIYSTSYSKDEALVVPEYLEYLRKQIIIDQKNLNKLTHLYNTIGASGSEVPIDRRTSEGELQLDISLGVAACYDKYWSDRFNTEFVKFPKHNEVVNWGVATVPDEVVISLDGGSTTITVDDIIGAMYDRDAVVATMDRTRFVSIYDQWNDRNVFKLTAERRYVVDPTENAIIYLND